MLKRSHEKFKISILGIEFVWIGYVYECVGLDSLSSAKEEEQTFIVEKQRDRIDRSTIAIPRILSQTVELVS